MKQTDAASSVLERQAAAVAQRLLGVREVAARLGVSSREVWKLTSCGRMPAPVRLSRSVRWRESDISEFIRLGCPCREDFEAARRETEGVTR